MRYTNPRTHSLTHRYFFINQRIEFYLNNAINLRLLLHTLCHVIPTKWRSYRGHRLCDATSPHVLLFTKRVGDGNDVCWLPSDVLTPAAAATVHLNSCGCVGVCVCGARVTRSLVTVHASRLTNRPTDRQTETHEQRRRATAANWRRIVLAVARRLRSAWLHCATAGNGLADWPSTVGRVHAPILTIIHRYITAAKTVHCFFTGLIRLTSVTFFFARRLQGGPENGVTDWWP